MENIDKFYAYLSELQENYTKLAALLKDKLDAVVQYDVLRLDGIIKQEQVFVLVSKGFDTNIKTYREKLSLRGDTLGAVIDELPDSERERFRTLFKQLQAVLEEVRSLNESCQKLIEERLYSIDKAIKELDKTDGRPGYGKNATATPAQDLHMLSKSI